MSTTTSTGDLILECGHYASMCMGNCKRNLNVTYTVPNIDWIQPIQVEDDDEEITIIIKRKKKAKPCPQPYYPYPTYPTIPTDTWINETNNTPCLIEQFFKDHPNERFCFISCPCPKHGTWI